MNQFVKQAQALQANMQKAQAEIASMEVTGESVGGDGRHVVAAGRQVAVLKPAARCG
jgi:DNA-binding protein YbaB